MQDLVRDTLFGQLIRQLSRKRALQYEEEACPEFCLHHTIKYDSHKIEAQADTNNATNSANIDGGGVVGWHGPLDPGGSPAALSSNAQTLIKQSEPTQLVDVEEVLRYFRNLSSYPLHILRLFHLHVCY